MGLLALAGAVSGMGQGLQQGLSQVNQGVIASGLAQEADKRARERDAEAYQRQRWNIEDERRYSDQLRAKLFEEKREQEGILEKDRLAREEGNVEQKARIADKTYEAGKGLKDKEAQDLTRREKDKARDLAGDPTYTQDVQKLADAKESRSQRIEGDIKERALADTKNLAVLRDKVVAAAESGDHDALVKANRAYLAFSGKLMESEKLDQAAATALMRDTREQIRYLQVAMKDLVPGSPEYEAAKLTMADLQQMNQAAQARIAGTSGVTLPKTAQTGGVQIKDPFAGKVPGMKPKETPDSTVAKTKPSNVVRERNEQIASVESALAEAKRSNPQVVPQLQAKLDNLKGTKTPTAQPDTMVAREQPAKPPTRTAEVGYTNEEDFGGTQPKSLIAAAQTEKPTPQAETAKPATEVPRESTDPDANVMRLLQGHEGFKGKPYKDTTGNTTLGYGHNLDAKPLTKKQAEALMKDDIADARAQAAKLPYYETLDPTRKDAVTALAYNLGPKGLAGFKKFHAAMASGDYQTAANELLNSTWAKQVGSQRAAEMAYLILHGRAK